MICQKHQHAYVNVCSQCVVEDQAALAAAPQAAPVDAVMAAQIHYPEHWDTAAYPTVRSAIWEIISTTPCSECALPTEREPMVTRASAMDAISYAGRNSRLLSIARSMLKEAP